MQQLLPACIALLISLTACQTRDNTESIKAINKSLTKANELIAENNDVVYGQLTRKQADCYGSMRECIWTSKALVIKDLSKHINRYIGSLKRQLGALKEDDAIRALFKQEGDSLYHKLVNYSQAVILVLNVAELSAGNKYAQKYMEKEVQSFKKEIGERFDIQADSTADHSIRQQNWKSKYVDQSTSPLVMAMLYKIQNDVLVTENSMIHYLNSQSTCHVQFYEQFYGVTMLSSSYVKAGQVIEVTAGVGTISAASSPIIHINDTKVPLNEAGVALYNLKVTGKPGKHTVPVKIKFFRPDGSVELLTRNLRYIIAE